MTGININKVISKKNVEYWFNVTDILQSMIGECIEKAEKGSNVAIAIDEKLRESDFVYKLIPRE